MYESAKIPCFRNWRWYPISVRDRLYVGCQNANDGPRFAGIFNFAWKKIPANARRQIVRYWRSWRTLLVPDITLSAFPIPIRDLPVTGVGAHVTSLGRELWFCTPWIMEGPDDLVAWVIAHELAHVYQHATNTMPSGKYGLQMGAG